MTGAKLSDSAVQQARYFFDLSEVRALSSPERAGEAIREIEQTGSYVHTYQELVVGARLAWRNHARCLGRAGWRSLRVLDARGAVTADAVSKACWEHLLVSTNGGALRSVVTVLPPAAPGSQGIQILNPQLIRYAGYRQDDGSIVGDPLHVGLTDAACALGWRARGGRFDILPVLLQMPGEESTRLFEVPPGAVLEVELRHPEFGWFADLGLRWHANPAISDMCLEIGGISYPAAPFSGWYVSSEIGARNLSDVARYNMLPEIAQRMGLDTSTHRSLWLDRALLELNQAVLYSYREAGVLMVDHHTAAAQFISHVEREHAEGRQVPAEWGWVIPPLSASATPTYHRQYDPPDFDLRPNWVRRPSPADNGAPAQGCPLAGTAPLAALLGYG
jgi:nitric-oxide synthase